MSFPIINWRSSNEVLVREFTKGFTETGFIRIYNLWNEDESEIIEEWYSTVKNWFLTANNKSKYRADQSLQNGWHDINETYLNPRTDNDFKQCFEIDQFDNFEGLPPTLRNSIIKTFPLIHKDQCKSLPYLNRC